MSKHTPSPWAVVTELRSHDEIVADMVNKIWVIPASHQPLGDNYADALLVSAAPDLLAALLMVLDDPDALDGRPRTYECVRAAISKATGEE